MAYCGQSVGNITEIMEGEPTVAQMFTDISQDTSKKYGDYNRDNDRPKDKPSSVSYNANFPDDYGNINIVKKSYPSFKDFYLLNKTYSVSVEICGTGRVLDNLTIKEKIDPKLKTSIIPPFPNIVDPFNELSKKDLNKSEFNNSANRSIGNYSFDSENNTILIKISKLSPKNCIRYNFNIESNKTGVFPAVTLVRISGDRSKFSDIYIPFDLEVRPPEFEAHIDKDSPQAIVGYGLNVTYNIIHRSGWCADPFTLNVTLKNSSKNKYIIIRNGSIYNGEGITLSFNTLKYSSIDATIVYEESGDHLLPEILVENQVVSIPHEEREIHVYQRELYKYMDESESTFSSYGLALGLFLSLIAIIYEIRLGRKEIENLDSQLKIMEENLTITKIDFGIRLHKHLSSNKKEEKIGEYIPYQDEEGVPRFSYDPQSKP